MAELDKDLKNAAASIEGDNNLSRREKAGQLATLFQNAGVTRSDISVTVNGAHYRVMVAKRTRRGQRERE